MDRVFDYEDVQLIPNKCIVNSRSECDTSIKFGPGRFRLPVVPSNMQTIIDESIAVFLAENNYFYIMHRFKPETRLEFIQDMRARGLYASVSVGIKRRNMTLLTAGADGLVPEYITMTLRSFRCCYTHDSLYQTTPAGQLPDSRQCRYACGGQGLENAGADATKVGIGPEQVCITKLKTGFGTGGWQLAALRWCSKAASKPIIADGGIRTHGDIAKSIRFGASMVMIGSLFAGHEESPGITIEKDGKLYKEYFGSASEFQKGERKNVEGKKMFVEYRGSLKDTLIEMEQDLQSSISYAGGNKLEAIRNVDYVIVKNSIFNGDIY